MRIMAGAWMLDSTVQAKETLWTNKNLTRVEEWKFVERPAGEGVRTGDKPPEERWGHGLLLFNYEESKDWAKVALTDIGACVAGKGGAKKALFTDEKEADTRACYTMLIDHTFWQLLKEDGKLAKLLKWHCHSVMPDYDGLHVDSVQSFARNEEMAVVVIRTDHAWEMAFDYMRGRIVTMLGPISFKKKSRGPTQPPAKTSRPNKRPRTDVASPAGTKETMGGARASPVQHGREGDKEEDLLYASQEELALLGLGEGEEGDDNMHH